MGEIESSGLDGVQAANEDLPEARDYGKKSQVVFLVLRIDNYPCKNQKRVDTYYSHIFQKIVLTFMHLIHAVQLEIVQSQIEFRQSRCAEKTILEARVELLFIEYLAPAF